MLKYEIQSSKTYLAPRVLEELCTCLCKVQKAVLNVAGASVYVHLGCEVQILQEVIIL